jgi:hypothetical protein
MLRNRFVGSTAYFMAPPDTPGASSQSGTGSSSSGGASSSAPAASSSPASSTPASTVAPGVVPPPHQAAPGGAVTPPSVPSADGSGEAFDFSSIFEGPVDAPPAAAPGSSGGSAAPSAPPASAAPAVVPPQVPAGAEPAAQPPVQPQPGSSEARPGEGGQPPAGTPPASDQSPGIDPYDPLALSNHIRANEAAMIEHAAKDMFALSPEDVQALETDAVGTVPKLFAKAWVRTQANMLMQMGQMVPEMIRRATHQLQVHNKNEESFYTMWPQIKRDQHGELVTRYARTYRMMYPQATKEQMMADVGPMVLMAAKIPFTASPNGAPASAHPTTPGANGAHRPPQPQPFVPAAPGPAASGSPQELTPWEAMFQPQE